MDIGDEAALGNKEEEDDGTSDQQDNIVEGTSDQDDVSSTEGGEILSDVEESVSSTNNQDYENFKGKDEAVNSPTGRLDEKLDQLSETNEDEGSVGGEGEKNEEYDQDVESQENDTEEDHENQEEVLQEGDADDISSQEDFQEEGIVGDDSVYKERNEEENTEYNEVSSQDDMQGDDLADIQSQEEEEENDKQSEDLGESSRDSNFKTGNKEIGDIDDDIDDEDFSVDDIKELDGDADDTSQEETHVLDKETFEELWKKEADSGGKLAEEDSMSLPGEQNNVQKNDIVPDSTTVDTKNQPEGLEDADQATGLEDVVNQAIGLEDNTDLITSSQQSDRSGDNDVEKGDEMDNEEIVDTEGDSIGSSLYDENEDREGKGFDEFEESAASPEQSNDNNIVCSDSVDNEDQPMEDEEAMGETNGMDSDLHNEQLEDVSQESTYIEQENDMSDDGEIDDDEDDMKNIDDNGSSDGEINDESDLKNEEMNIDKDEKDEESGSVPMSEDESMHGVGESVEGERESRDKLMDGSVDPKQPSNSAGQFMVEQGNSDNDEDWNTLDLEKEEQGNVGVDTSLSGGVQKEDRVQKDVEPEDIDSPEETEDIDSPESDMGEEEGEVEPDNPASPVSEEGQLDEANRREDNENIYNDVSDEEESYSDDDDEAAPVNNVVDTRVVNRKEEVQQERPKFTDLREKIREGQLKAQSSLPEDHVELDYDEDGMDDAPKATDDNKDKMDDSRGNDEDEKGEDGEAYSDRDDGEVDDDEDCEEGEIKEPGARKPFVKPICRFYTRGQCTWGNNCRFLHPGINDKGNYRLIERPGFESPTKKSFGKWNQGEGPFEELAPPPMAPPTESAWERGLRHAKEMVKKASQRKETDANFEEKKMNLSIEEDREFNKENDRLKFDKGPKDPYYDQVYDDEYYDKPYQHQRQHHNWQSGQYENFEVRWTREPEWVPPAMPPQHHHRPPPDPYVRERDKYSPRHLSPPPQHHIERFERQRDNRRREWEGERPEQPIQHHQPRPRPADSWHDPWRRSKSPKRKPRTSRSHSRGRRRARRSHSYSSSFSSSSFSGSSRSRSRSSSYSSYSSHSSASRSSSPGSRSSKSKSPAKGPVKRPQGGPVDRKVSGPGDRANDQPRSAVAVKGKPHGSPDKRRRGMYHGPGSAPGPGGPPKQRGGPGGAPPRHMPTSTHPGRPPQRGPPPSQRGGPRRPMQKPPPRRHGSASSSGSSLSRSRSRSSSSSRSSSNSSVSSFSSHTSSSSSGSADSEHLYRGVGDSPSPLKQRKPAAAKPKKRGPPPQLREKGIPPAAMKGDPRGGKATGRPDSKMDTSNRQAVSAQNKPKDPLKLAGQKPNIKLTLLNKAPGEKGQTGKKRPADQPQVAPPSKRMAHGPVTTLKAPDKVIKKPDKVVRPTPVMKPKPAAAAPVKAPVRPPISPTKAPPKPSLAAAAAAASALSQKEKKSTSSRREELLKQLKAVEDAIARKRSKMS